MSQEGGELRRRLLPWWAWLLIGFGLVVGGLLCWVCIFIGAFAVEMVRQIPEISEQFTRDGYAARVERIEPAIPGLVVEAFPSVKGALKIINERGEDVYIWRLPTPEQPKAGWRKIPPGQDMLIAGEVEYGGWRDDQPMGEQPGQVMKTWTVQGRVEDKWFVIYGVTVYDPLPP